MRILFDDEAMALSRPHVRVDLNRAKTELLIGTVPRNSQLFVPDMPVYTVPRHRVRSVSDLAVAVDYYAKTNRVSNDTTVSVIVMRAYELRHGLTVTGNI